MRTRATSTMPIISRKAVKVEWKMRARLRQLIGTMDCTLVTSTWLPAVIAIWYNKSATLPVMLHLSPWLHERVSCHGNHSFDGTFFTWHEMIEIKLISMPYMYPKWTCRPLLEQLYLFFETGFEWQVRKKHQQMRPVKLSSQQLEVMPCK